MNALANEKLIWFLHADEDKGMQKGMVDLQGTNIQDKYIPKPECVAGSSIILQLNGRCVHAQLLSQVHLFQPHGQ